MQGTEIAPNIRKIRMPITAKGRGKSGGARVITYNAIVAEQDGKYTCCLSTTKRMHQT